MISRKKFLQLGTFTPVFLANITAVAKQNPKHKATVISTWAQNVKANAEAWKVLASNGKSLDAVEAGVKVPEADPNDMSVGYGGLPDRDGKVTLDACIMDQYANIGAVMALEKIMHAISVARMVMEKTPHVQLAGEGALQFALANGFEPMNLLTPESERIYKEWLKKSNYDPMAIPNMLEKHSRSTSMVSMPEWPGKLINHDTIGMLAMDNNGDLSGACTTSGMAFKMHGRVGDSPIIGAGLYVDNQAGAATSTGVGEEVVRICGSHLVVELMRQGYHPEQACKKAVERMIRLRGEKARSLQVGFIAMNNKGEFGAYSILKDFTYCVQTSSGNKIYDSKYLIG